MQDFKIFSLGDCAEIISGGTPKISVAEYWNGNISWISIKDFSNECKYIFETEKKITAEGLKKVQQIYCNVMI